MLAAQLDGVPRLRIISRHMLPAFTSHIIASLTLAIPARVLLNDAQNLRALATAPWLLFPGLAVVVSVVALNFVGDGMRDAADPYGR